MSYTRVGKNLIEHANGMFNRARMLQLANAATMAITRRSFDRGEGADDSPYPEYSEGYARFKQNSGRNVNPVNLTWSGRLRQSIRPTRIEQDFALIDITGAPKVYGSFVNEYRPFMVMSPKTRDVVRVMFRALYGSGGLR